MTTKARNHARRLPPGAAELLALRKQGFVPSRWIIVTRAARGPRDTWHVRLPRHERLDHYDLGVLRGLALLVNLADSDGDNDDVIHAIEAARPACAAFMFGDECRRMYWGEPQ